MRTNYRLLALVLLTSAVVAGCATSDPVAKDTVALQRAVEERATKTELNDKLAAAAIRSAANHEILHTEYSIGGGDLLEISVFGVDELTKMVRVGNGGMIMLPLVGELSVGGRSPREVEQLLVDRLSEYMHDPDVSIFVSEYHSQRVAVTGAVNTPAMHTLTQPRTVLELLSMSGGLSREAGNQIYVRTKVDDAPQRLIIDLDEVLSGREVERLTLLLAGGDSIFVPEAGVVFVEGAVNAPGSYSLRGGMGVIEAIAMAGGAKYAARESDVQVITNEGGERVVVSVPLDKIRANEAPSYSLRDGDIVVVPSNAVKESFAAFWRGFSGIFGVGYGLNGP